MTKENWVGDVAPVPGDAVKFSGAVRTTPNNDFPEGTSFSSITFAANNFTLSGNGVTLTSGISVNRTIASATISLNVDMAAPLNVGAQFQFRQFRGHII